MPFSCILCQATVYYFPCMKHFFICQSYFQMYKYHKNLCTRTFSKCPSMYENTHNVMYAIKGNEYALTVNVMQF